MSTHVCLSLVGYRCHRRCHRCCHRWCSRVSTYLHVPKNLKHQIHIYLIHACVYLYHIVLDQVRSDQIRGAFLQSTNQSTFRDLSLSLGAQNRVKR